MERKLRIAVWHNLPSGGGKRQLYSHVKGLLDRGHHVESWCPDTADQKFLPLRELVTEHVVPLGELRPESYHITKPLHEVKKLLSQMEQHCRLCAEQMNRMDFDVLFANACTFFRTTPIAMHAKMPSAIYLGEPYRWFYEALPELAWLAPAPQGWFTPRKLKRQLDALAILRGVRRQATEEAAFARSFDTILVNSVYSRESVLRAYNLDSRVCYLGVDTDYYRPTGEPKERFVVGLGTLYHGKGVDRAIRAVGHVRKQDRPHLVWVGNGAVEHDLREYERLAKDLDVTLVTKLHPSDQEVISFLSRAAAIIYTSRLEPFGYAPLEANACGTAAVAIAEGGVRESIRHGVNGFLVADEDPTELAKYLEKLVSNPAFATEMGSKAREHVCSEWNMETATTNIENALVRVVSAHGGSKQVRVTTCSS